VLLDTMFELPGDTSIREVVVNDDAVQGSARPLLIYADKKREGLEANAS
jgi:ATP-dependent Clp protease ATP-binding subunit ClpX